MVLVIHKRKLIITASIIVAALALCFLDLKQTAESFFMPTSGTGVKTVILDPGHGGEDPGAVSDYSGVKEKDINLKIALSVKGLLEKENYKVLMTREEDILKYEPGIGNIVKKRKQDLETRRKMIDSSGADIVVSIHLNKFPQTQYFGAQVFFPPNFPESKKLADHIQLKIREFVDPENKREALVKKEPIIILKNPKVTTAIVECGFLSNQVEETKLITEDYQKKLANAIKDGINSYFMKSVASSIISEYN